MKAQFWMMPLLLLTGATACVLLPGASPTPTPAAALATTVAPPPIVVSTATPTPTPSTVDCGQDLACLIEAAQTCRPATGQYVLDLDIFGAQVHTVTQFDIHGPTDDGQCAFEVATVEVGVQFSEDARQQMQASGMSDQEIEAQRQMMEEQQRENGPSGSCVGRGEDLAAMLQRWQEGSFSASDWEPFTCTGGTLGQMGEVIEVTVEVTVEVQPLETATPSPSPPTATPSARAYPQPVLVYNRKETLEGGGHFRYWIGVVNWQAYPDEWFQPAPDLPPCGQNTNAARAWVGIYEADSGSKLYGFCALTKPEDLTHLWFTWPVKKAAPRVYVEIWDRATGQRYRSEPILVGEATPTPTP